MSKSSQLQYLQETYLLNYSSPFLVNLVHQNGWNNLDSKSSKIEAIYNYVRDQIPYGYTPSFQVCASEVLKQGKGNCITKTTLLMALLRATGIPCRLKAARIEKVIHRGLLPRFSYKISPRLLHHTWVELFYKNHWIEVGGHIVDKPYISKLQFKFPDYMGSFYGYGIAVLNFKNPPIKWEENDTAVQSKAVTGSLGTFDDPDSFFATYPDAGTRPFEFRYRAIIKPALNKSIEKLRNS